MADSHVTGRIPTSVALALLESLRDVDTPADPGALAESDLPLNLQRRLGLSSVVFDQIRRYEQRRGGDLPAAEVASLFELIGRRTDAPRIFVEAGQRIARSSLEDRRAAARLGLRVLPRGLRERRALRRVRRIARTISPESRIRLHHKPHSLVVERALTARAAVGGVGCALLDGAIQYVFTKYRTGDLKVIHSVCEARDGDRCEWAVMGNGGGPADAAPDPAPGAIADPAAAAAPDAAANAVPEREALLDPAAGAAPDAVADAVPDSVALPERDAFPDSVALPERDAFPEPDALPETAEDSASAGASETARAAAAEAVQDPARSGGDAGD